MFRQLKYPGAAPSPGGSRLALKAKNAAAKLDIHPRTLARWEKAGLIRSLKLARHRLYAVKDLEALIENARNWNTATDESK